jgi:hypothetical protein
VPAAHADPWSCARVVVVGEDPNRRRSAYWDEQQTQRFKLGVVERVFARKAG